MPTPYEIDWHEQWKLFAHNFKDGFAQIELADFGTANGARWPKSCIKLAPGPGFGDLSHPTTRLVLSMMAEHVYAKNVLDVGSGSGILSLAAAGLGAKRCFGIDIDPEAIQHAKENATLNDLHAVCSFGDVKSLATAHFRADILLMNMIRSEQQEAYRSLPAKAKTYQFAITSGVLKTERDSYLAQTASWGFCLLKTVEEDGWLAFLFAVSH